MFPTAPAAPAMGQPPAPFTPFTPPAPTWPGVQPYQVQQPGAFPPAPTSTIFQQPGQVQSPGQPPADIPLTIPQIQLPGQQQDQVPAWAQGLIEQVNALQNNGPQTDQPWDDNNRPRTWAELQGSMDKMATDKAQEMVNGLVQQQQQAQVQQQQLLTQANQNLDAVEGQLQQMGILPPVVNPNDPNDPGKAARAELYAYAMTMGASEPQQLAPAAATLYALHQNGQYFDKGKNAVVTRNSAAPGAFAPIAGAGPSMAGSQPGGNQAVTGPTTAQLATLPLSSLAQMGASSLGLS